ncbi:hypothetical protein PG985_003015 [Apiospora marii]|uniref:Uncharacterized protein n=1 Tax=Apiospora marii TaxID=335849 RepID=A0ABR1RVK0_9PEZI
MTRRRSVGLRSSSARSSGHGCPRAATFSKERLQPSVVIVITIIVIVCSAHEINHQHGPRLQLVELEARLQHIGHIEDAAGDVQADVVVLERKADQTEVLMVDILDLPRAAGRVAVKDQDDIAMRRAVGAVALQRLGEFRGLRLSANGQAGEEAPVQQGFSSARLGGREYGDVRREGRHRGIAATHFIGG